MLLNAQCYVHFVTNEGEVTHRYTATPQRTSSLVLNRPKDTKFVVRYYPSMKAYRVFDARRYTKAPAQGQFYRAPPESFRSDSLEVALAFATISM